MRARPKQLSFTRAEAVCLIAGALLVIALFLPAAKLGKVLTGLDLLVIGTLMSFLGSGELAIKSGIAVLLNAAGLAAFVVVFTRLRYRALRVAIALTALICFAILLVPYSRLEQVWAGYYLWLCSILTVGLTPLLPCHKHPAG